MHLPRVLVIGGSLGGLFAANTLRAIGCEVQVFERVEQDLAARGAGIGTHEALHAALRRLGLALDDSLSVQVQERICLERSGQVSHALAMPQVMTAWARMYRPLKDLLPPECYFGGHSLERVEQDGDEVTAVFAGGARVHGDLLIGADGIRSSVREQLAPEIQPRYAGYVAWRGLVEEAAVSPATRELLFEKYAMCLPEGELMLTYPVPGRGCNFVWYRPADERDAQPVAPPLIRPEVIASLRADARALLAPQMAELVERAAQPFFQPICDLESQTLVFGRAALLGDAAFVARPHVGMGVTKAALDARCLAESLSNTKGNLDSALARYESERRLFGARIVARARGLGDYVTGKAPRDPLRLLREIGSPVIDVRELSPAQA
jgi:2-polyprenyl-6-methoxyphenol hydroxylase-like FAD-dependent oxidoreductase